jgi:N-acetyl sugar amidotransferase
MGKQCERCLYDTNHPFGLTLNNGICSGCITHDEKNQLDWALREQLLKEYIRKHQKRGKKRYYDCVVPIQGDAEDYYVVEKVLKLNLNPLIVCVNDYFKNDIGWHNLHNLITHFDLDSLIYNPDITVYQELVRTSLRKNTHMLWPFLALHTAFPVHVAKDRNIPLIIWGQHQSIEQVGKFSHVDEVEMTQWSRIEHDLFGLSVQNLIGNGAQVNPLRLIYYNYPSINKIGRTGLTGIYLSNYFRWDPYKQNSLMTDHGFIAQYNNASFDSYERAGSSAYYQIHDLLKFRRHGYRKVRDHLVREIRHGRITKGNAIELENKYTSTPTDIHGFFDWLGMTKSGKSWFIKHILGDMESLISTEAMEHTKQELPPLISELHATGKTPERDFIRFGKGISF